jgi:multiple sugar transport system substrate-binding protein
MKSHHKLRERFHFFAAVLALVAPAVAAHAQEKVTLTFTRAGDSATVSKIFDPMVAAFEKTHPNITIKSIPMGFDEANKRFPTMAATGTLPDVMLPPDSLSASLGLKGAFLDLEGKLSEDLVKDTPPSMWNAPCATADGKRIGLPANAGGLVLWYNADIFKKAGLDPDNPPKTWDEFVAAAKAIKEKTDVKGALGLNGFARNDIDDMFAAVTASRSDGQWYWNNDTKSVRVSEASAEALDFVHMLVADGLTEPNVDAYNRADTRKLLRDGEVAMTFDGPWVIGALKGQGDLSSPDSPYRTARFPGTNGPDWTALNISCWNIAKTTKHPEEAVQFMEFLANPENTLTHAQSYGVVPTRLSVLQNEAFSGQPWNALAAAAAGNTVPPKPGVENLSLVEKDIPGMIQSVILGKASGMEALKTLASEKGWPTE